MRLPMIKLKNDFYQITIAYDENYKIESSKNRYYDLEFNPENYTKDDDYTAICVKVKGKKSYEFSLIGDFSSDLDNRAILEERKLIILQKFDLYAFDLEKQNIENHKDIVDDYNFGIYRIPDGYIIHGELTIKKLDLSFNQLWEFSGRDIFVNINGNKEFEIDGKHIKLCDFQDNCYVLDFDGNEI